MFLHAYYHSLEEGIKITPEQGSRFAKEVSDDFNPLHNPEHPRFCVPGDLLFALSLHQLGISQAMQFKYTGMVGKDTELLLPQTNTANNDSNRQAFSVADKHGKTYIQGHREGPVSNDAKLIEQFTRAYVAFSGHSFPHILVPLMREKNVMINTERPMVIYESMAFSFDTLNIEEIHLQLSNSNLSVTGKRGTVSIEFTLLNRLNKPIGSGKKTMLLSGLRDYDETKMLDLIAIYEASKKAYQGQAC